MAKTKNEKPLKNVFFLPYTYKKKRKIRPGILYFDVTDAK